METLTSIGEHKSTNLLMQQNETPTATLETNNLESPAASSNSHTITQQPKDTERAQTLPLQPLTAKKSVLELIPLNNDAFLSDPNDVCGGKRNPSAVRMAKFRAVTKIVDSVLDNDLSKEQLMCVVAIVIQLQQGWQNQEQ